MVKLYMRIRMVLCGLFAQSTGGLARLFVSVALQTSLIQPTSTFHIIPWQRTGSAMNALWPAYFACQVNESRGGEQEKKYFLAVAS